jgi:hypothetical protein
MMFRRIFIAVAACSIALLVTHRIWRYATFAPERLAMPAPIAEARERALFQSAGGRYSPSDIAANGPVLPSQKFRGFQAKHDYQPKPGDRVCPVTFTKANPDCTWIVDGQTYEFCCPPCIGEFVRQAKERPAEIKTADSYIAVEAEERGL